MTSATTPNAAGPPDAMASLDRGARAALMLAISDGAGLYA